MRDGWVLDVARAEHPPWGFGAWHWAAFDRRGRRRWFVTADALTDPGRESELEATYRAATDLRDAGLPFVVPCLRASNGRTTRRVRGFAVSVTEWVGGSRAAGELTEPVAAATWRLVEALHRGPIPRGALVWDHRLRHAADLERLGKLLEPAWVGGPLADAAQRALRRHLTEVPHWLRRHEARAAQALESRDGWVVTHGEPGLHNQIVTEHGPVLVDWESMRVAPRERDLSELVRKGQRLGKEERPDPALLELFDLRWRLDEVGEYAARFRAEHSGDADDQIALGGLIEQLERPDWFASH